MKKWLQGRSTTALAPLTKNSFGHISVFTAVDMAHFSEHQVRHYKKLFDQYSGAEHGRLNLLELYRLMPHFGPEMTLEQVKELIYQYDSSCSGSLDFDDFLEVLSDYSSSIEEDKQVARKAFEYFAKKSEEGSDRLTREQFAIILSQGESALSDEQIQLILTDYFGTEQHISSHDFVGRCSFCDLAWCPEVAPPSFTVPPSRDISIRIFQASNLDFFSRTKLRWGEMVEYETLDPIIKVKCGGAMQETSVLVGQVNPQWNQDIILSIKFPATDLYDIQHWTDAQVLTFSLYDCCIRGTSAPQLEWLGSASLPLRGVLSATSATATLTLRSPPTPPGIDGIKLEVLVSAAADGITEFFDLPEETWNARYRNKIETDLRNRLRNVMSDSAPPLLQSTPASVSTNLSSSPTMQFLDPAQAQERTSIANGRGGNSRTNTGALSKTLSLQSATYASFWEYYSAFYSQVKLHFRRRYFQLVGLDECNTFRCLVCFIRPLPCSLSLESPLQIARNVARIAVDGQSTVPSLPPNLPPLQCCSPATVLFRRKGSVFEHAILLCGLLLGRGMNAYVCLGHAKGERHAWVVTIEKRQASHVATGRRQQSRSSLLNQSGRPADERRRSTGSTADESAAARAAVAADNGLFYFEKEKFAEFQRRISTPQSSSSGNLSTTMLRGSAGFVIEVRLWESTTGEVFLAGGKTMPFERVGCVFNHRNIWINVQNSDLIGRTRWDLENKDDWLTFLAADMAAAGGPIECWYSVPSTLCMPEKPPSMAMTRQFVSELVEAISAYRRRHLHLGDTLFHGGLSRTVQNYLEKFERSMDTGDRGFMAVLEGEILELLPDHHTWHGFPLHFHEADIDDILQQLGT